MDVIPKLKRESSFESSTSATSDSTEDEVTKILRNLVCRSTEVELRHLFFCRDIVFQKLESFQRLIFKTDKRPWPDISSLIHTFFQVESIPLELKAEFLSAVMSKKYEDALKLCDIMLRFDAENDLAKEYRPVLVSYIEQLADESSESESEESSDDSESR